MRRPRVAWVNTDPGIASARLRSLIPRDILESRGLIERGTDIIVAAKHGWPVDEVRKRARRMVMDVCDDHFSGPYQDHYRQACKVADVVTCNSREMQRVIHEQTGLQAVLIDDPYEDDELEPSDGEGVLWFGHRSNLPDLEAVSDQIRHPLTVISNHNWSMQVLDRNLRACRAVLIPTGKSMAKSANRAIKAIRYGKFPVCGHMPAHMEIGLGTDHLGELLDSVMSTDFAEEIKRLQDVIRDRFHPEKVAKDWYRELHDLAA